MSGASFQGLLGVMWREFWTPRRLLPNLKCDAASAGAWRIPRFQAARRCWQKATGRFWMEFCDGFGFELSEAYEPLMAVISLSLGQVCASG